MSFDFVEYIVPAAFLWYAYSLLVQKPAFGDTRRGFPTRRAREKKEIWDYVQRCAGAVCFVMAVLQAIVACVVTFGYPGNQTAYWLQIGFEVLCMLALIPIVNVLTERRFPEK